MDSVVVLMVLLAGPGLASVQGRSFISEAMNKDIEALEGPLHLKDKALMHGSVFLDLLEELSNSTFQKRERTLLVNATLSVYVKIFSTMLEENGASPGLSEPQRRHLDGLRTRVLDLQKHMFQGRERQISALLQKLASIQVDDRVVQRKAMNELKEVFDTVSRIGHHAS